MFSECFNVFSNIVRHLGREPDFWAENRIFKKFLKSLKTCSVGVFWVSRYFSIVRLLSREPDFWPENWIFKNFPKSLKTCLAGVFWVFHGILALFDIWAENRIFQPWIGFSKIVKMPQSVFSWCFLSVSKYFLALFDIWAENRIFEPRTGFSKIS